MIELHVLTHEWLMDYMMMVSYIFSLMLAAGRPRLPRTPGWHGLRGWYKQRKKQHISW